MRMCVAYAWLGMPPVSLLSPPEERVLTTLLSEEDERRGEQTWTQLEPGAQSLAQIGEFQPEC